MKDSKARFVFYLGFSIFCIGLILRRLFTIDNIDVVSGIGSGLVFASLLYEIYLNIKKKG